MSASSLPLLHRLLPLPRPRTTTTIHGRGGVIVGRVCPRAARDHHPDRRHRPQLRFFATSSSSSSSSRSSAPGGGRRRKIPSSPSSTSSGVGRGGGARTPSSSTTIPPTLRLAPHMRAGSGEGGDDGPLLSFLKANPLLFAVVIFPTLAMGGLLLARPGLRPVFLGGAGAGGGGGMGGSRGVDDAPREAPAYDDDDEFVNGGSEETVIRASATTTEYDVERGFAEGIPFKSSLSSSTSLVGRWRDVFMMRRRHFGGETSTDPSPALGKDDDSVTTASDG